MFKEFKEFAMKGNMLDMAVGIIIGAAFGTIVGSLVADILTPPLGLLMGNVDFGNLLVVLKQGSTAGPYLTLAEAQKAGAVTINYGIFLNQILNFIIVAFAVFMLVRSVNKLRREKPAPPAEPTSKECPYCFSAIAIKATRCPHCTSDIKA